MAQCGRQILDHLADKITSQWIQALVNQGRFRVLTGKRRRIDLLQEQKYSHHRIMEEATRAELGRLAAAELIMEGIIYATKDSIGIDAQIINPETSEIVAKEVVQGKEPDEKLLERLAQRLSRHFPLLEVLVVGKEGHTLLIEAGQRSAIQPGMKLILYREGKEIRHPTTGAILGKRSEIIGGARIERMAGGLIEARITETEPGKEIKVDDKFVTNRDGTLILRELWDIRQRVEGAAGSHGAEGLRTGETSRSFQREGSPGESSLPADRTSPRAMQSAISAGKLGEVKLRPGAGRR